MEVIILVKSNAKLANETYVQKNEKLNISE